MGSRKENWRQATCIQHTINMVNGRFLASLTGQGAGQDLANI